MEPEISQRFERIEGVLVRLAEAQAHTDERQARTGEQIAALTQAQRRTDEQMAALIQAQRRTDEKLVMVTDRLDRLTDRLDRWAEAMIRGNTVAAERHAAVIERLDRIEGTKGLP